MRLSVWLTGARALAVAVGVVWQLGRSFGRFRSCFVVRRFCHRRESSVTVIVGPVVTKSRQRAGIRQAATTTKTMFFCASSPSGLADGDDANEWQPADYFYSPPTHIYHASSPGFSSHGDKLSKMGSLMFLVIQSPPPPPLPLFLLISLSTSLYVDIFINLDGVFQVHRTARINLPKSFAQFHSKKLEIFMQAGCCMFGCDAKRSESSACLHARLYFFPARFHHQIAMQREIWRI